MNKDIRITPEGDLVVGANGDLEVVTDNEYVAQEIMVRLKTYKDESPLFPGIGSLIPDYAGSPNTREVGENIEMEAMSAIVKDGFLNESDVYLKVYPTSPDSVSIVIDPDQYSENGVNSLEFDIDLHSGEIT